MDRRVGKVSPPQAEEERAWNSFSSMEVVLAVAEERHTRALTVVLAPPEVVSCYRTATWRTDRCIKRRSQVPQTMGCRMDLSTAKSFPSSRSSVRLGEASNTVGWASGTRRRRRCQE